MSMDGNQIKYALVKSLLPRAELIRDRLLKSENIMKITKEQVLENLEQVKGYIQDAENKKEEKTVGIAIRSRWTGEIIFQSTKTTWKEAVEEGKANLRGADLRGADLFGANLRDAELDSAKFYGRGGTKVIKKENLVGFLGALGFMLEE